VPVLQAVLDRAVELRGENHDRPTKTVIDILQRLEVVAVGTLKRSTLDRHLDHLEASRRRLHRLGVKTFQKILTTAPLELVIADFHHGPYVRLPGQERAQRALLLAFIDHFSRYLLESRYYLHEDFAVLRFGFRRLLLAYGPFVRLYIDNGPSFHSARFHAACQNDVLEIQVVHSIATFIARLAKVSMPRQPLLRDRLAEPQHYALWQRIGVRLRLRPLNEHEIALFLDRHMQAAGATTPLFESAAVTQIFQHSRGVPRLAQNTALDALLAAMMAGKKSVDSEAVQQAIVDLEAF
jgi:hypothetical protein